MKALLKLNLTLHLRAADGPPLDQEKDELKEYSRRLYLSYPISAHVAGEREVAGMPEAAALAKLVEENVRKVFASLSIAMVEPHVVIEVPPPRAEGAFEEAAAGAANESLRPKAPEPAPEPKTNGTNGVEVPDTPTQAPGDA